MPAVTDILGILGGSLGLTASLPQLSKSLRTGKTDDLHLGSSVLRLASAGCWTAFGVLTEEWTMVGSSSCVALVEVMLAMITIRARRPGYKELDQSDGALEKTGEMVAVGPH